MIGKAIAHYKILEKLGEGGMGVVYRAEDTKLKRTVALKFLPPELTKDAQAKARFVQEAQAAAALDHPNICAVFEIGEAEGAIYIAMPFVKGKSLKEKMAGGLLSIDECLDIVSQVGEGLKEAHERGIIHRDIKPGNIMLTEEGRAKVMDFGLAKLSGSVDVTKTLGIIGTVAFMSPEQARGEAVDHRTDIWSFGAMLYEMVTGQTPFGRKKDEPMPYSVMPDTPAFLHSILYDPVEPPGRLRQDLPKPLEQIILKALEKDKPRRYQSMDDVLKDLRTARSPELTFPKAEKSIIILPFENISPDPDQEYFCDGMTEEIIADLSKIHSLRVISRTSAMMLKGTKKDVQTIARVLNVQYVLEGSVRKAGNNLRITAQLIDGLNDAHLWAEKYSGTLDDIFDIQEKVSRSIVEALRLKLTPEEKQRLAERPIENAAAYEYYLKAEAQILKHSEESLIKAIRYLEEAIDISGENALLYAGQALAYFFTAIHVFRCQREDPLAKAGELAGKALAMEPDLPKAHAVMGFIRMLSGDARKINYHLRKALALNPDDTRALSGLVLLYAYFIGKTAEAATIVERLRMIDPFNFDTSYHSGLVPFAAGQYDLAREAWRKSYEMYPDNPIARLWYSIALAWCGKREAAFSIVDEMVRADPNNTTTKLGLLMKYGFQGNREALLNELTPDIKKRLLSIGGDSYLVAVFFAMANDKEEALNWLENAVEKNFINYPLMAEKDPFLANIRGEPRFQKLMERVKDEWEHFEA